MNTHLITVTYDLLVRTRYVASDCDSVEVLYDAIHYTRTPEDAAADSILAGVLTHISY